MTKSSSKVAESPLSSNKEGVKKKEKDERKQTKSKVFSKRKLSLLSAQAEAYFNSVEKIQN